MKSIIFIITFLLFLLYPQQYFASIHVFVDPGHGGCDITTNNCGTNTYINNPDTSDCCTLYCEKHINLEVGLALKYCLDNPPGFGFPYIWSYEYSRLIDTSYTPAERAAMANTENAEYLISIHHNRSADTAKQYTVVLYSDNELTSCTHTPPYLPRDHDSTLAVKLGYRLERFLGIYLHADSPWNTTDSFSVLCRSLMPSALTEACFISQPSMADKYFNSAQTGQDYLEALAPWTGLTSTILGQGFGRVEYRYWGQDINFNESPPPIVCVDTCEWGERTEYELPYLSCWLEGEEIWLQAESFIGQTYWLYGYGHHYPFNYKFHHWERRWYETGDSLASYPDSIWTFNVSMDLDGNHYYVAYFTGGPYELSFDDNINDAYF